VWPRLIVFGDPGIRVGLQLVDGTIHLLAEGDMIELSALGSTGLRIWRERRVGNLAAQEIERLRERTVVFLVWRYVGLRASLFVAFRLEVAAQ
jgi:hypothetical protein